MPDQHQRMFFALQPPALIARELWRQSSPLTGGRRLPWQTLHVTLAFIGEVNAPQRNCLLTIGDALCGQPFTLTFERLHYRAAGRGMLWLTPQATPFALQALQRQLRNSLLENHFPVENRPFRPHVTLARQAAVADAALLTPDPVVWPVADFCLMLSHLSPQGSQYEVVRRWPFRPLTHNAH